MYKSYKLGEVCEISSGKTPSTKIKEYWERGTVPWLTQTEISSQTLTPKKFITQNAVKECGLPLTTKNSVLLCNVSEAVAFYVGISSLSCNQQIFLLEPNIDKIKPNYLYYLLCAEKNKLNFFMRGTIFKSLTKNELKNFPISLPSLPQQALKLKDFKMVYNSRVFQSEVIYQDFLLKMIKKILELGDLLFLKYKDSEIRIGDEFQINEGRSGGGLHGYSESPNGTIKWINQGVLTDNYFLTESTPPSKWLNPEPRIKPNLDFIIINSPVMPAIFTDLQKHLNWNQTKNELITSRLVFNLFSKKGSEQKNAVLYFALRQKGKELKNSQTGSAFQTLKLVSLRNFKVNQISNPTHQKMLFTILNSKLAKIKDLHRRIKDLHRRIKDLHRRIKDLLLLKYFGKK